MDYTYKIEQLPMPCREIRARIVYFALGEELVMGKARL
jgi:hypothetical protein